ncbi:MAG: SDR family NAD(P)-dependent oxidoreductase, partial [Gammaproteobacteria bacterium]|nr:SDR family NAD(P)-dependent oxidoreductase [Gammaproteobacteria bacterium]
MDFDFSGKVAVVTGAGSGIGRSHALMLAKRGARLVVNDLGSKVTGDSKSSEAADKVVDEIIAEGGEAIAEYSDVSSETEANEIIETAISKWGRVDVLINNAGILRDKSFSKITMEDYRKVIDVHLMGSVYCTHAAWPYMRQQNYGRVIFTTSVAGLYGNFGQSNYSAAKMSLVGLTKTLKQEGAKYNIRVNAIAP